MKTETVTHQFLLKFVFFIYLGFMSFAVQAGDFPDCACPKVQCHRVCQKQIDIKFYSEKCGANGNKVRSCAKPSCDSVEPLPPKCLEMGFKPKKAKNRAIASTPNDSSKQGEYKKHSNKTVAVTKMVEGTAWLERIGQRKTKLKQGVKLNEKDIISTNKKSKLRIEFTDGNVLNLSAESRLKITTVVSTPSRRQSILNLIKGKVRSKVKQKYKGAQNYYQVRTRSAVAGVRGTDFIVSFSVDDKDVTKVSTLTGEVKLMSPDSEQSVSVGKGQYASFVASNNGAQVFDDDDISEFVNRGYMTPVYKMTASEVRALDWETELLAYNKRKARETASMSRFICKAPKAKLNQCAWTCKNNPPGSKKCHTEMKGVSCVRTRCNANGQWKGETRLPASAHDMCKPNKTVVKDCDY